MQIHVPPQYAEHAASYRLGFNDARTGQSDFKRRFLGPKARPAYMAGRVAGAASRRAVA